MTKASSTLTRLCALSLPTILGLPLIPLYITAADSQIPSSEAAQAQVDPPILEGNPMDWPAAPEAPPLREMLDPATYDARFNAARTRIDLASLRDPGRPTEGEEVFLIEPGSPADKLGIKVGDIVTAVDGIAVGPRSGQNDGVEFRQLRKRQVVVWSPGGGQRTLETDEPHFGYWYRGGTRLAEAFARGTEHDPQWDDQVLVAAANFMDDPDLAETALLHAQRAGYDGRLLYPLAAKIAFQQFRFNDALAFGWHLLATHRPVGNDLLVTLNQAAVLDFKLEQSLDLASRFPNVVNKQPRVVQMAEGYRAMPADNGPNPIARLPHLKRNKVASFSPFLPPGEGDLSDGLSKWAVEGFSHDHSVELNVPTEHDNRFVFGPSFANVAASVKFDLHDTDSQLSDALKLISVELFDTSAPQRERDAPKHAMRVHIVSCMEMDVEAFGLRNELLWTAPPHIPWHCKGTLRIVILHNRCEATLDGRRVFYGPVLAPEASRRYGISIVVNGLSGRLDEPVMEELIDPVARP